MTYEIAFKLFLWGVLVGAIIIGLYIVEMVHPFVEPYVDFISALVELFTTERTAE
ncbi:MAG: hypothetical protein NPIRA01_40430 [Nitrospirales bacterium]|nr:MAG: hypothetical protein NPIRA01_40430 [Nitrospirales bacterium]